ncbi:MAG: ABC transporter substrate-binding protein [Alphaproteobacteria bacterium]|nr:ABC transporter substrate-binding protein [Alphaproteobacteria bacterium]
MKATRRKFVAGAAAGAAAMFLGGKAPYYKRALGQGKKHVVWGQTEPLTSSWDPSSHTILAQIYFDFDVFGQLIRTPMRPDNPDEIIFELATGQKIIDEKTIEYTLRQGVKFHNGQPFTAHDVKATFEYASDPSRPAGTWYPGKAECEVVDDYTVRVRGAEGKYPGSLFYFLAGFLPILSADDIKSGAIQSFPNGCGAYKFKSREGDTTILEANEDYILGAPQIKEVVYQFIADPNTRLLSLLNGELDIIERVEPEQYETLQKEKVVTSRTISTENKYLHFRCHKPPFDDVRLRHAAAHAIDREQVLEVMGPAGHKSVGQLSPVKFGYTDTIPGSPEYDPEKCQALLAEAGFPKGEGLPKIEYLTSTGFYPKTKEYGEVITALLQEQGFPVELTVMEVGAWIERVLSREETAPQLADTGWMTGSPEPNLVVRPMWHSDGLILTNCGSPDVDAAIEKQQGVTDTEARRKSIQTELMPALAKHLPSFGLFTSVLIHAHNPAIEGIVFYPNGPVDKHLAVLKA